ncbi:Uncharacterised protein [Serratia plymuthica]|nr:Uncharacterised protein [Serratia plymuthica]
MLSMDWMRSVDAAIGLSISASVNKGKGNEKGNGTSYTETTVNAGKVPGSVYDFIGGMSSEFTSGFIKNFSKPVDEKGE